MIIDDMPGLMDLAKKAFRKSLLRKLLESMGFDWFLEEDTEIERKNK